jgi:hypothetical protein
MNTYEQRLNDLLNSMNDGTFTEIDLERFHFMNVTPREEMFCWEIDRMISTSCKVCDYLRKGKCEGKVKACEKFVNHYDKETCKYCVFNRPLDKNFVYCQRHQKPKLPNYWCLDFQLRSV